MSGFELQPASWVSTLASLVPGIHLRRGVEFGNGGGRALRMHVARPKHASAPRPAIVYIFGGGWQNGGIDQGLPAIAGFALRGYVAASVEYRLSQEATFPAQIEDCKCAVRYLRAHAGKLGINPERIGAFGPSAGGHLAALLGTTAGVPELEGGGGWPGQRSDVQAVAVWSAPVDFLRIAEEHGNAHRPDTMTARLIGGVLAENAAKVAAANPTTYLRDGAAYPPFLVLHGASDRLVPPGQSELLFDALRRAGVESELTLLPRKRHGFLGFAATRRTLAFFDRHLRKQSRPANAGV